MEVVLYADVLFLIDFSMDFLTLYAAGKLLHLPITPWRLVAAAALGGVFGVAGVVLGITGIWQAVGTALLSAAMSAVAFGCPSVSAFGSSTLAVWGCGALLAGFMTVFSGLFSGEAPGGGVGDMICGVIFTLLFAGRTVRRRMHRGYADVTIPYGENVYTGRALVDTGNLLTDPISALPVILLREREARLLAGDEVDGKFRGRIQPDGAVRGGVRAVPVHGKPERILYGFLCDRVEIRQGKRTCRRRAVVCVDFGNPDGYGGCGALLPGALLA